VVNTGTAITLREGRDADRIVVLATRGVLAWACCYAARPLLTDAISHEYGKLLSNTTATALYLPLQIALMLTAMRNVRTRASAWLLAGVAIVILGFVPVSGVDWLASIAMLAGLVLIAVPPPASFALFIALVTAPLLITLADPGLRTPWGDVPGEGAREYGLFYCVDTIWVGMAIAVLVWLARMVRQLQAAREELASRAVAAERVRIDAELAHTVGTELDRIIAAGERAAMHIPADQPAAAAGLRELTGLSRATLAQARRTLAGYRGMSLRTELEIAATLLTAGGISTDVVLPDGNLPHTMPEDLRVELRTQLTQLLSDSTVRECALRITGTTGRDLALRVTRGPAQAEAA
jgi:two-component system, NarL family, sensor histidine kinase DesK